MADSPMAGSPLVTTWRFEAEVLSPLHVGAGGPPLRHDADFLGGRGEIWVVDVARAYARLSDAELTGRDLPPLSRVLSSPGARAESARYRLAYRGSDVPRELLACLRDPFERPYLPGSTVKGAIRTALLLSMLLLQGGSVDVDALLRRRGTPGLTLERGLLGDSPNRDLLRGLRVADAVLVGNAEAEAAVVGIYSLRGDRLESKGPEYTWCVEALPAGTRLGGTIVLDEYLFGPSTTDLPFNTWREWLAEFPAHCRAFAGDLAAYEAWFYGQFGPPEAREFCRRLGERIAAAGPDELYLQLGWGTGWTAKTIGLLLERDPRFLDLVSELGLDRGRRAGVFPKTRRLVERGTTPEAPLGWVRLRLAPAAGRPAAPAPAPPPTPTPA